MSSKYLYQIVLIGGLLTTVLGCNNLTEATTEPNVVGLQGAEWCVEGVTEFKRGDILVKPNLNFLPGSAQVPDGITFGHAVIVTQGYQHEHPDSLLSHIKIIESVSLDVPPEYQVREINALVYDRNLAKRATSFDRKYTGFRYRLRLDLDEAQIDRIIAFAREQEGDLSCWHAMKSFKDGSFATDSTRKNWADNENWYCSLLVWQAFYYVTDIDLDVNHGYEVYPNDLIANPVFNNRENFVGRARF